MAESDLAEIYVSALIDLVGDTSEQLRKALQQLVGTHYFVPRYHGPLDAITVFQVATRQGVEAVDALQAEHDRAWRASLASDSRRFYQRVEAAGLGNRLQPPDEADDLTRANYARFERGLFPFEQPAHSPFVWAAFRQQDWPGMATDLVIARRWAAKLTAGGWSAKEEYASQKGVGTYYIVLGALGYATTNIAPWHATLAMPTRQNANVALDLILEGELSLSQAIKLTTLAPDRAVDVARRYVSNYDHAGDGRDLAELLPLVPDDELRDRVVSAHLDRAVARRREVGGQCDQYSFGASLLGPFIRTDMHIAGVLQLASTMTDQHYNGAHWRLQTIRNLKPHIVDRPDFWAEAQRIDPRIAA